MALRDYEGFDNLGTSISNLALKGWSFTGPGPQLSSSAGRFGTFGFFGTDHSASAVKIYDQQSTWVVGYAYAINTAATTSSILAFNNTALGDQITLRLDGSDRIQARLGGVSDTVIGTGTKVLAVGAYNYIECALTIHNSTGTLTVRVNEVNDIVLSGIDTQFQSAATADRIYVGNRISGVFPNAFLDDIYIEDGTDGTGTQGAPFNTFLGDCRVSALLPSGNGTTSGMTGSDGNSTDNYLLVDESGLASSSDYVESNVVSTKDTYAMADLPSSAGTVHAVRPVIVAAKTDAGARSIASVIRLSGTEVDSANQPLTTTYQWLSDVRFTKPGGGAWDIASVNAMELGQKITV